LTISDRFVAELDLIIRPLKDQQLKEDLMDKAHTLAALNNVIGKYIRTSMPMIISYEKYVRLLEREIKKSGKKTLSG
jgi:hypothetical protein